MSEVRNLIKKPFFAERKSPQSDWARVLYRWMNLITQDSLNPPCQSQPGVTYVSLPFSFML